MLPVRLACLPTVFTGKPADVGGWVRAISGRREARGDSLWDPQGACGGWIFSWCSIAELGKSLRDWICCGNRDLRRSDDRLSSLLLLTLFKTFANLQERNETPIVSYLCFVDS